MSMMDLRDVCSIPLEAIGAGVQSPSCRSSSAVIIKATAEMAETQNRRTLDPWVTAWRKAALEHQPDQLHNLPEEEINLVVLCHQRFTICYCSRA